MSSASDRLSAAIAAPDDAHREIITAYGHLTPDQRRELGLRWHELPEPGDRERLGGILDSLERHYPGDREIRRLRAELAEAGPVTSRCQRTDTRPKPNGTIGCDNPDHGVNEPPVKGLTYKEHVTWVVDHAPPLSEATRQRLAVLLAPEDEP